MESESAPSGACRPALHAFHARVLRVPRKSPQFRNRKRHRPFHQAANLQPPGLLVDGRHRVKPHQPETVLVRLIAGEENPCLGRAHSACCGAGGEKESAAIHEGLTSNAYFTTAGLLRSLSHAPRYNKESYG